MKWVLPFVVLTLLSLQLAAIDHLHIDGELTSCHLCVNGFDAPLKAAQIEPLLLPTLSPRLSFGEYRVLFGALELPRVRGPPANS